MATKEKEIGEGGVISSEHRNLANELNKMKVDQNAIERERAYRDKALLNLSSKSGVFTGNQEDVEREIARLKAEEAQNN